MKTNTQHTPGPWHLRGDTVLVTPSLQICQADRGNKHPDTAQANARLIAAAPALLEALKACEEALAEVLCLSNKQESSRVQARAAIAQAEGRGM